MSDIKEYLRRSELFAGLDPAKLDLIASYFHEAVFEEGAVICREGEVGDRMFVVMRGEASVVKEMGWGRRELKRMGPGEIVGEMSLITGEKRSATVKTLAKTECLWIGREDFSKLAEDPSFAQSALRIQTKRLQAADEQSVRDLLSAYQTLMFAVAKLADSRDPETGAHLTRTRNYCALLAEHLAEHPKHQAAIYPSFIETIYDVSPLHDIGKVAIHDAILLKPGRLTDEEYEVMKTHAAKGAETLQGVVERCDQEIFRMAFRICRHHHEKWDGSGYPDKLAGEAIPIEARIMALADVYDALLSKRVYKPPMSYVATREEIRRSAGTFFDPTITQVMLEHIEDFEEVHRKNQET
jgi:response regulator RpfG family c-di-GMP phosphodiesterase